MDASTQEEPAAFQLRGRGLATGISMIFTELEGMRKEWEQQREELREAAHLRSRVDELQRELDQALRESGALRTELEQSRDEKSRLLAQYDHVQQRLREQTAALEESQSQVEALGSAVVDFDDILELFSRNKDKLNGYFAAVEGSKRELEATSTTILNDALAHFEQAKQKSSEEFLQHNGKWNEMMATNASMESEIEAIRARLAEKYGFYESTVEDEYEIPERSSVRTASGEDPSNSGTSGEDLEQGEAASSIVEAGGDQVVELASAPA